jgi:hypothetical protein
METYLFRRIRISKDHYTLFNIPEEGVTKTSPLYPVLGDQPTSNPSSYILPRDCQGQLRSNKL